MSNTVPQKPLTTLPANETERLAALHRYRVLDTPPEVAFDRITRLAARLFEMPSAMISLVDESRAWFKSNFGFGAWEIPRDASLCSFAVLIDEPLIIPDARLDARFACNPLVQGEPGVRFYAGAPLLTHDGFNLGTLCLIDSQPREALSVEQQATLVDLAAMVVDELELRLAAHNISQANAALLVADLERQQTEVTLRESEEKYRSLFESMDEGFCICEMLFDENGTAHDYRFLEVNLVFEQLSGLQQAIGKTMLELVPNLEAFWFEIYAKVVQTGEPIRYENQSVAMNSWFDVNAFRIGEAQSHQFAILFTNITARKKIEQERERFSAVSSDLQAIVGNNGYFQWVSPTFERILGWTLAEMTSHPWINFLHPDDINASVSEAASLFSGKETFRFENRYRHRDGSYRWFLWKAQPYPEEQAIYAAAVDITERKQTEAALREAHIQLESALAAGAVYTWRWNIPTNRVVVNAAFAHLFGVDPAGATTTGLPIEFFTNSIHPEDRPHVLAAIEQAISTGVAYTAESRVYTETGEERWLTARGQVEYDAAGKAIALPGALADITDRKRAEEDRDRLFQLSHDMLAIANMDGYFIHANPAWKETLGYTTQELTAQPYIEFVHPDDRAATLAEAEKLAEGISTIGFENRYRCSDGSYRWISWSVAPFALQKLLYCVGRDVTESKQAEAEREQLLIREQSARAEAEAANRLKDEFLAVLSHELRSPLNPILGWTNLLLNGRLNAARQTEALKTIERNAKLQSQLIEDLLDISRIMQGKMTFTAARVNLTFVISAALETVRLAAEAKNIQILLDLDMTLAPISGDAARLQQVVWNLLTNAVKFTAKGGQVLVELRQMDQLAQIRVIDTGKGINPQFLPHVFEYFRQEDGSTTRKFGGLGLGLAIVRQIVELHGGTVQADSLGEGQGATFTVRLPSSGTIQGQENTEEGLGDCLTADQPLAGLRVLVVDDEPDMRDLTSFTLEQAGAEVMTVATALDALPALTQFQPDILLSDIGMPDMDGYSLLRQIRALPPARGGETPAIALTAYAGDFNQQQAKDAGFQQHLAKPVEPERLIEAIVSLVRGNA